jgi:hypothetical protein
MPRASLSVGLLSTRTSGVQKKNLHTAIGRPSAFISPTKFRLRTSECTKTQTFFLLFTTPFLNGGAYSISQGRICGEVYHDDLYNPCYWNVATRQFTILPMDEYPNGIAGSVLNSMIVGQIDNLPCYWDSNGLTILSYNGYSGGVALAMTATIIVGKVGNVPCYWTISTNQLTTLSCLTYEGGFANSIDSNTAVGNVDGYPCYWDVQQNVLTVLNGVSTGDAVWIEGTLVVGVLNTLPGYWELPSTTFTPLYCDGYDSGIARCVNNNIIVGTIFTLAGDPQPCYWDSNRELHLLPMTVNHKTFTMGEAYSISQNIICGTVQDEFTSRPCYWVI